MLHRPFGGWGVPPKYLGRPIRSVVEGRFSVENARSVKFK
jgi:hypothetical protein